MELRIDIGFEQLVQVVQQLPEDQRTLLKAELSVHASKSQSDIEAFKNRLLAAPVMDDKQYERYKTERKRLAKWRK